ncbi:MAG TPA: hypothetical protein VN836_11530 [Verrucomicrobiae bacterium]|nr:hypothetical protein [Verrucomicrobiae bacterium]
MKIRFLAVLCLLSCLALEVGCGKNNNKMETQSHNSTIDLREDHPIVYCWFVEDNGAGRSGYDVFYTEAGRPLEPDERLFSTLEDVRHVLKDQENRDGRSPIVIPKRPDWVPQVWRVRDLSTNEVAQLKSFVKVVSSAY